MHEIRAYRVGECWKVKERRESISRTCIEPGLLSLDCVVTEKSFERRIGEKGNLCVSL